MTPAALTSWSCLRLPMKLVSSAGRLPLVAVAVPPTAGVYVPATYCPRYPRFEPGPSVVAIGETTARRAVGGFGDGKDGS